MKALLSLACCTVGVLFLGTTALVSAEGKRSAGGW